ncbi:MAG: S8 family serine peptidase [Anaerolineales bacterium]|nr:S8 family serine peptidase [Anaerolineales bacterium]
MKRVFSLLLTLVIALGVIITPTVAGDISVDETVDIIVLTDGSASALAAHIQGLGGEVRFQYQNVPGVAATILVDTLGEIANFPGVNLVEKDGEVTLDFDPVDKPMSFAVEGDAVALEDFTIKDISPEELPEGWSNFLLSGAVFSWEETGYGAGSTIAVVDTGVWPSMCLDHVVIGAPGYPDGYNASGDGVPANSPYNHYHGTFVSNIVAADCGLVFADGDPVLEAYRTYLPFLVDDIGGGLFVIPNVGIAPSANIYPVKVFDYTGSSTPTSVILDGLDHLLTLKTTGALDIDIINMSLGGGTGWDGRDAYDRFMAELNLAGIMVVTSASNEGPVPNSIGSPATSFSVLSVGALDYDLPSSILYEWLGLRSGFDPGMGEIMRPTSETRVANFSSRGPLSDGRSGPEISALGMWNFAVTSRCDAGGCYPILRWGGGTSFSSPTVAGGAALLNAYDEAMGNETDPVALEGALINSANPDLVGNAWDDINSQGAGALDIPAALDALKSGNTKVKNSGMNDHLEATVLKKARKGKTDVWESGLITVDASEAFVPVFEISEFTSKVIIEVFDISTPDNYAYAYWENAMEVHVQSAKRSSASHPVEVLWYPNYYGDAFDIVIEDGQWTFWGMPWTYQPMEPGLMKLGLMGDYSNEGDVSFRVRITRENYKEQSGERISNGIINTGDVFVIPVNIPEGTSKATFDLTWNRDWAHYPTSDVDMLIFAPDFSPASWDGASFSSPERAVIIDPAAGTWYVLIDGYETYKIANYDLFLTLE